MTTRTKLKIEVNKLVHEWFAAASVSNLANAAHPKSKPPTAAPVREPANASAAVRAATRGDSGASAR